MEKRAKIRTVGSVTAVLVAFAVLLQLVTALLQPKYMTSLVEGSMVSQYYGESGGHDVIFVGDCEVYANFTPLEMYRQAGITAYVRGTAQQMIWQSYYLLKETLSWEVPRVVVLNVNAMRYSQPVSEAYNRMTIDTMRWSREKIGIIRASMTEEETFLSYVFPILRYHSRFDELTGEDIRYLFRTKDNTWKGHLVNTGVVPVENLPARRILADYRFSDNCWSWLDRIRELCGEHGVELILIKAPSVYPYWYEEYEAQIKAYAREHNITYYNLLNSAEAIGIDYQTDTYDGGMHLNLSGATKLSHWFADLLAREHGLSDRREAPEVRAEYEALLDRYDAEAGKKGAVQ